jgi:hypothetical protein
MPRAAATVPYKNSIAERLSVLEVGGRVYIDTDLDSYRSTMSWYSGTFMRSPFLKGVKFSSCLLTAVGSHKAGDIRYLICIERTK